MNYNSSIITSCSFDINQEDKIKTILDSVSSKYLLICPFSWVILRNFTSHGFTSVKYIFIQELFQLIDCLRI